MRKVTLLLSWVVALFATSSLSAGYLVAGSVPDEIRALVDLHTQEADMESVIPARMAAGQTGYLIVTTNQIKANLEKLNAFIAHKEARGFTVTVITEDDYGNTAPGPDCAAAIRAWMHENYQSLNLLYALMIGNPNEKSGDVPYHLTDFQQIPSDYPSPSPWRRDQKNREKQDTHKFINQKMDVHFSPVWLPSKVPCRCINKGTLKFLLSEKTLRHR